MLATELMLDASISVDFVGSDSGGDGDDDEGDDVISSIAFNVNRLRSRHFKWDPEEGNNIFLSQMKWNSMPCFFFFFSFDILVNNNYVNSKFTWKLLVPNSFKILKSIFTDTAVNEMDCGKI